MPEIQIVNPATGETVGTAPNHSVAECMDAVEAVAAQHLAARSS